MRLLGSRASLCHASFMGLGLEDVRLLASTSSFLSSLAQNKDPTV